MRSAADRWPVGAGSLDRRRRRAFMSGRHPASNIFPENAFGELASGRSRQLVGDDAAPAVVPWAPSSPPAPDPIALPIPRCRGLVRLLGAQCAEQQLIAGTREDQSESASQPGDQPSRSPRTSRRRRHPASHLQRLQCFSRAAPPPWPIADPLVVVAGAGRFPAAGPLSSAHAAAGRLPGKSRR